MQVLISILSILFKHIGILNKMDPQYIYQSHKPRSPLRIDIASWVRFSLGGINYYHIILLVTRNVVLNSAIQHKMSPKLDGKWGTEYLSTRFP